ncbi:MAG: GTP 3',8-cyclase MoaA [Pseudomonadota bacterium]
MNKEHLKKVHTGINSSSPVLDRYARPLQDLRVSVTDRCNFRCGYCMPKNIFGKGYKFLAKDELLSYDEITRLVAIFATIGVEKIRLTGGEPLLRKDLETLVEKIRDTPAIKDIAMTTNASLLSRKRSASLKAAGVNRLNISLDALNPLIYRRINQIPTPLNDVLDGIGHAVEEGFSAVKVNMVVQKGINDSDILPMVEYFRHSGVVLRFIEFMDVGNHNQWTLNKVFTSREIIRTINSVYPLRPSDPNYTGEVAKRWFFEDGSGEIGVISSISQPFCGDCSRARLSAIGELYTCLFASQGYDLRHMLRSGCCDEELIRNVEALWMARSDRYSMERSRTGKSDQIRRTSQRVEMSYIGG